MTEKQKLIVWTGFFQLAAGCIRISRILPDMSANLGKLTADLEKQITEAAGPPPETEKPS